MKKKLKVFLDTIVFPFKRSLRFKLTAVSITIVLLTVAIITVYGYYSVYSILKENMSQYLQDNINKSNERMDAIFLDADRINSIVVLNESKGVGILEKSTYSPDYEWFTDIKEINSFLTSLVKTQEKVFTGITVIGTDGKMFKGGTPQIRENTLEEAWFKKVVEAKGSSVILKRSIGEYGISDEGNYVLSVGRAIMRYGESKGFVLTDIDFSVLNNIYNLKSITTSGGLFIFNSDQEKVFESVGDDNLKSMNASNMQALLQKEELNGHNREITWNGQVYIAVKSESSYSKGTTVALVSRNALLKDFYKFSNRMLFIVLFIVLFVLAALSVLIVRITQNIKELMKTMEAVSSGDINARPDICSVDEIGRLSGLFVTMMEKVQNLMEDIKNKERDKRKAELEALQAQINPHFLCNTLNTIKYLAHLQNVKNITELTTSLVRLLRITIDNTESYITIEEELEHVRNYLTIQRYKYAERLSVVFSVQEEVLRFKTIKMVLQPLVENAIIHGIEPSGHEGLITIKIYPEDNSVKFKVIDNGVGMSEETVESLMKMGAKREKPRFSGIGIGNVHERIKMFFGDNYGVRIYSQPGICTSVEVNIPIVE